MEDDPRLEPGTAAISQLPSPTAKPSKGYTPREWMTFFGILVIATSLYTTGYVMLITPYPPKIEPIRADFQREPWYFERGYLESVAEVFFAPAHYIDVLIRPDYWKK